MFRTPNEVSHEELELRQDLANLEMELEELESEYWSTEDEQEAVLIQASITEVQGELAKLNLQVLMAMVSQFK